MGKGDAVSVRSNDAKGWRKRIRKEEGGSWYADNPCDIDCTGKMDPPPPPLVTVGWDAGEAGCTDN